MMSATVLTTTPQFDADASLQLSRPPFCTQLLNDLVDKIAFLLVEVDSSSNRLVGPAAGASAVLSELLRHGGPIADHFDQVYIRHFVWVGMMFWVVAIESHVVCDRHFYLGLHPGRVVKRRAVAAATMKLR